MRRGHVYDAWVSFEVQAIKPKPVADPGVAFCLAQYSTTPLPLSLYVPWIVQYMLLDIHQFTYHSTNIPEFSRSNGTGGCILLHLEDQWDMGLSGVL